MSIFGKKQVPSGEGMKEKSDKIPISKKPKSSGFEGKSFLGREEIRSWLKKEELWKISQMSREERMGLEKKIFDKKRFGQLIDPKEAEKVYQEIKNYPIMAKEKYGFKDDGERIKVLKILEKFLGK